MEKATKNVDAYISQAPKGTQAKLKQVRLAIKGAAPHAIESISYGMPAYDKGQICWFGLNRTHIGLYLRPPTIAEHKKELAGYKTTKSAVHLSLDKKIPIPLIKKLVKARIRMVQRAKTP